jgi:hypothetical protein
VDIRLADRHCRLGRYLLPDRLTVGSLI